MWRSLAAVTMPDFDLHNWFGRDELEACPACGERAGIRLKTTGSFLCLDCGHVGAEVTQLPQEQEDGAPKVD